jgi:transcriptional regulator with XRE-family HTH domain
MIERLKSMRVQLGVSQKSLAAKLNQPQSWVSKTERLERRLDLGEFVEWAGALGLEPEELLKLLLPRS